MLCANFILPCGENHYGFFLRCPTSFYNRPPELFADLENNPDMIVSLMLFGEYPQKSVVDAAVKFSPQAIEVGHIFRIGADHQCPLPYGRGTPRRGMP